MKLLGCVITVALVTVIAEAAFDYCQLSNEHTMCKYKGVGPNCTATNPEKFKRKPPNAEEQKAIVKWHNDMRGKVAMGKEKRGEGGKPQPMASDMYKMEWDDELATSAQRLAEQCEFAHDCAGCKGVPNGRFWAVGQNLAWGTSFDNNNIDYNLIHQWYDEVVIFNPEYISPAVFKKKYGHYTQVVWWKSRSVGCGAVIYNTGRWYNENIIVCNYGPIGNGGYEVYAKGEPCSRCPKNTTCENALCELNACVDRKSMLETDNYSVVRP